MEEHSTAFAAQGQTIAQAIADGVITARIRARLRLDPLTADYEIHVETVRSVVHLSGFVESAQVRTQALRIARDVAGVRRVSDFLDVRKLD